MKLLFRTLRTRPTSVTPASLLTHRGFVVSPLTIATKVQRPSHCQTMSGCSGCSACSSVATFFLNLESIATSHEKVIHPVDGRAPRPCSLFMWHTIVPHVQVPSSQISPSMSSLLLMSGGFGQTSFTTISMLILSPFILWLYYQMWRIDRK